MSFPELTHPFRFTGAGDVATVDPDGDEFAAQSIVLIAGTAPGERVMVPGFGLADPTFGDGLIDTVGLNAQLELYGPAGVTVGDATVDLAADRRAVVTLPFTTGGDEEDAADAGS